MADVKISESQRKYFAKRINEEFDIQISEDAFKYGRQALQEKEDKLDADKDKMLQKQKLHLKIVKRN